MRLFYDTAIYGFLLVDGLFIGFILYQLTKRGWRWQRVVLLGCLIFAWFVIFYGSFIEPQRLVVTEQNVTLRQAQGDMRPAETIRIVLISDFHLGPYKQKTWVEKVVARVNALSPELIVIAGDFILDKEVHPEYLAPLKNLSAQYGVYAVLGNHDYIEGEFYELANYPFEGNERVQAVKKALAEANIRLLRNESKEIVLEDGKSFLLGGTDEYWTLRADARKTFKLANAPSTLKKILIVHNPDEIWDAQKAGVDLVLAAHTHGGQIRLPWLGSVPPIPDKLGRKYDRGLFQFGETQMFITSGLGETGPRARLLVPPEIALLEINL
ncbi:metallophosphoesterase [Candidatus Peregrinibacteria bacterium]|nr:metallophosphoesterase [Candidatus Peregrinibacteria bacterium]